MTSPEAAELPKLRGVLAQRLARALATQAPLHELQELQTRLQLIDGVLAAARPRRPIWRRHLLALLAVGALVSLAAWWPLPRTAFVLELEASALQMQMPSAGQLDGQALHGEIRAEGYAALDSADPALVQRGRDGGAAQLSLQAERLNLRRLAYGAGTRLDLEAGARSVRLALDGAPSRAEFEFSGAVSSSLGGAPRESGRVEVAEWITLHAERTPTELWLALAPGQGLTWRGLQPASLRLLERQAGADGQPRWVSALHKATLRVPSSGRDWQLAQGSGLELGGLQVEQAELVAGERLRLRLSGSASRLVMDTGGFSESLAPSLLETLARHHGLGLFWGAAGLLWGISSWLRKAFGEGA